MLKTIKQAIKVYFIAATGSFVILALDSLWNTLTAFSMAFFPGFFIYSLGILGSIGISVFLATRPEKSKKIAGGIIGGLLILQSINIYKNILDSIVNNNLYVGGDLVTFALYILGYFYAIWIIYYLLKNL